MRAVRERRTAPTNGAARLALVLCVASALSMAVEAETNEYGDCECYCDGSYQGIIPVDDGVTESFCDNNGPGPSQCPNMGFTCDGGTTTVTWVYNSAYQGTNFDR